MDKKLTHLVLGLILLSFILIPVSAEEFSGSLVYPLEVSETAPLEKSLENSQAAFLGFRFDTSKNVIPDSIELYDVCLASSYTHEEYLSMPNTITYETRVVAQGRVFCNAQIKFIKNSYDKDSSRVYSTYVVTFLDWNSDVSSTWPTYATIGFEESFPYKLRFSAYPGTEYPAIWPYAGGSTPKYDYMPISKTGFFRVFYEPDYFKSDWQIVKDNDGYTVKIDRFLDGRAYSSKISLISDTGYSYISPEYETTNKTYNIPGSGLKVSLITTDTTHLLYNDLPDNPTEPTGNSKLTVYIKNSQTGALIANSRIVIDGLVDGEYYNVVNRTEPSGIFTITLQPTGGGQPNPDGYRLIVTADGYNNPMPEINFTVDDYKNYIHCLLDPIAGGPVNENKTFIDFFVRDMSSNPISGATVKFGKYTLITNSAGYTVFEVDKNNNYSWTVTKSGYGALTGNAVIGNDPRHTINTVLAPVVTPTQTTPIPTSPPIGPTPTMTAPTGESVSNWLEWFAAHFGMILGGGVEIGKIFMWLCFTVPVGVYVGKEAKAGAAGFMAGSGIVTLFFVLIGWVPIWLVVLLALIIGLLYAKEFNSPDNGGGR